MFWNQKLLLKYILNMRSQLYKMHMYLYLGTYTKQPL